MDQNAQRLGMTQTNYVNPNGLPDDGQITSARDLAILARALIREFPEYDFYWHLPGIRMGKRVVRNYNTLLGRYPGTDGMKTGFICNSGYNLVATATRDGRRLIAVVLGAPSAAVRAVKAAQLLEQGFGSAPLSWLTPSLGSVESLTPVEAEPANLHEEMCGPHHKRPAAEEEEEESAANAPADSPYAVFLSSLRPQPKGAALLQTESTLGEPVVVFTGSPKGQDTTRAATQIVSAVNKLAKPAKPVATAAPAIAGGPAIAAVTTVPWLNPDLGPARSIVPLPRARPRVAAAKP
jgi:D-alanyl-D-alanine carboxypeptidase